MLEFLIAGVQKAGTTALHAFLSQHPGLYLPACKELHFFSDDSLDWRQPDDSSLRHHFQDCQSGQMAGEATPIYAYWKPAAERIHRYNPAMKLIVLLRDPVERAYSHWAMEFGRGREPLDFSAAIRAGRSRFAGDQHPWFSYVERGLYAEQIERLQSWFGVERLLFLRTEDLREQHEATLDRACAFLAVDRFAAYPPPANILPVEPARVPPALPADLAHLRSIYRDDLDRTAARTGLDLSSWRDGFQGA